MTTHHFTGPTSTHAGRTHSYTLNEAEIDDVLDVVQEFADSGISPVDPDFYRKFERCDELLPPHLLRFLREFRDDPAATVCQVHGFPIDHAVVGPTPDHWERPEGLSATLHSDIYLALCGTALGDPFTWATLQYGRMIQDIFPIRGDEKRESGHGSEGFLSFHTDDAFRTDSADYLLLFGIRNTDVVPTFVAAVRDVDLSDWDRKLLSEPRFHIVPDDEHIRQLELRAPGAPELERAIAMRDRPEPVAVLSDAPDNPRVRLDLPFMRVIDDDPVTVRALARLRMELDRVRRPLVAAAGTLLILDNRSVAHARDSFTARYDGTDRWLRKIIVSRDLGADGADPTDRVRF
ncbi:taurine catabolism dioxygenase TauD [Streptacidiphilus pinicola]|uniref:Taurine catabolism dioxygenase TauD n=1 Tax=Streptacidiphilus pinicola TaxID=2219663 RepID=A0A2X0IHV8_9ACTN|nr:TauD/TfdA family dioxygenase [Streptacidiphilus pinicola]RAG83173.1 taurine catabolism dioxygenase TauD [Streptacidiphilus pinicola]